jgi:hypothetical protein
MLTPSQVHEKLAGRKSGIDSDLTDVLATERSVAAGSASADVATDLAPGQSDADLIEQTINYGHVWRMV